MSTELTDDELGRIVFSMLHYDHENNMTVSWTDDLDPDFRQRYVDAGKAVAAAERKRLAAVEITDAVLMQIADAAERAYLDDYAFCGSDEDFPANVQRARLAGVASVLRARHEEEIAARDRRIAALEKALRRLLGAVARVEDEGGELRVAEAQGWRVLD